MTHDGQLDVCIEKWKQFDKHAEESIGVRDRLKTVELKIELLEKQVLKNAIIGGIIGSLIGAGAAPALSHVIELVLGV